MRWFGNRNGEVKEGEQPEVKPKNQILQTPEKKEGKEKLDPSDRDKFQNRYKVDNKDNHIENNANKKLRENQGSNESDVKPGQKGGNGLERGYEHSH